MKVSIPLCTATLFLCFVGIAHCAPKGPTPTWTDPRKADTHPGFRIQGEYVSGDGGGEALQVASLDEGRFHVLRHSGGLPGEDWTGGEEISASVMTAEEVEEAIGGMKRVERKSPTLGMAAPEGARVIFDGEESDEIDGKVEDGLLWAGASTTRPSGDFRLHIEFRLPFKPGRELSSQDRGNSGLYIFNNYEVQIIDSFGLDFDEENNAVPTRSQSTQWCACFYKFRKPDVPMAFPPLRWQTYDIDFTAPRFGEDGEKISNARITVRHNGVLVHDDLELPRGTGAGGKRPEKAEGLLFLQDHGNPVAFRNIWLLEKQS